MKKGVFMPERDERKDAINRQSIDIDRRKASPVILASLIGCSEPMLDKYRQKGLLPQNTDSSIAECISFHCDQLRQLTSGITSDLAEQALIADTKLKISRMEGNYLDQKIKRGEFLEVAELSELFSPVFEHIQEQLHALARDFPIVHDKVVSMTRSWNKLGEDITSYAKKDEHIFVQAKINEDVQSTDKLKEIQELFGFFDE